MTAFSSTGELATAENPFPPTIVAWTPAVLVMGAALSAVAGAQAPVAAEMSLSAPIRAVGGPRAVIEAMVSANASVTAAAGGAARFTPAQWTVAPADMKVAAGAMAALVNDTLVRAFPSTAELATAEPPPETILRMPHTMMVAAAVKARSGAAAPVAATINIEPNPHGPVARPRRVDGQIILS